MKKRIINYTTGFLGLLSDGDYLYDLKTPKQALVCTAGMVNFLGPAPVGAFRLRVSSVKFPGATALKLLNPDKTRIWTELPSGDRSALTILATKILLKLKVKLGRTYYFGYVLP